MVEKLAVRHQLVSSRGRRRQAPHRSVRGLWRGA